MKCDYEYHNKLEKANDVRMEKFAADTHYFSEIKRNEMYSPIDYNGVLIDGRRCSIESKARNCLTTSYPTTFIECEKLWWLINKRKDPKEELFYINFFGDGVLLFRLTDINPMDLTPTLTTVSNKGYFGDKQRVYRYELPNTMAYKFITTQDGKNKYIKNDDK